MCFRRRSIDKWSKARWLKQVHSSFVAPPERGGVRATLVVRMNLDLLPKNAEELARQECLEGGESWKGFREYAVFCFECTPSDFVGYRMGDTVHDLLKDLYRELTSEDAAKTSREWIGADAIETDYEHLPGLFRAAFITDITGVEADFEGAQYLWSLPGDASPGMVVRFPTHVE